MKNSFTGWTLTSDGWIWGETLQVKQPRIKPTIKPPRILTPPSLTLEKFIDRYGDKLAGGTLYPQQRKLALMLGDGNHVISSDRQTGKSSIIIIIALYHAMCSTNKDTICVAANTESMARNLIDRIRRMYFDVMPTTSRPILIKNDSNELHFTNGTSIICCSVENPSKLRGRRFDKLYGEEIQEWEPEPLLSVLPTLSANPNSSMVLTQTGSTNKCGGLLKSCEKHMLFWFDVPRKDQGEFIRTRKKHLLEPHFLREYGLFMGN